MAESSDSLRAQIRDILLKEWDPSGAERSEAAHHTYDAYLGPLADLIRSNVGEEAIVFRIVGEETVAEGSVDFVARSGDARSDCRDDAAAMQFLIPGWTFDPKRPAFVR